MLCELVCLKHSEFFSLMAVCENVDHITMRSRLVPPVLNLYLPILPFLITFFAGAHCCVLTVCNLIFITLLPGGCLNPVISARCLPKKILILGGTPALKTCWKSKQKLTATSSTWQEPDADYFKWFYLLCFILVLWRIMSLATESTAGEPCPLRLLHCNIL